MPSPFHVRPAIPPDLPALAALAGALVRYHHALDARRFLHIEHVEAGYARFLAGELTNPRAVVLAAEHDGEVVGYAYGALEGRDWNALLGPHGALHDVLVAESVRRQGVAAALVAEMCSRLEGLGAPRVLLHTAVQNEAAQAMFTKLGFRTTMLEMTREGGGHEDG